VVQAELRLARTKMDKLEADIKEKEVRCQRYTRARFPESGYVIFYPLAVDTLDGRLGQRVSRDVVRLHGVAGQQQRVLHVVPARGPAGGACHHGEAERRHGGGGEVVRAGHRVDALLQPLAPASARRGCIGQGSVS
jgi:hypothetical protein